MRFAFQYSIELIEVHFDVPIHILLDFGELCTVFEHVSGIVST